MLRQAIVLECRNDRFVPRRVTVLPYRTALCWLICLLGIGLCGFLCFFHASALFSPDSIRTLAMAPVAASSTAPSAPARPPLAASSDGSPPETAASPVPTAPADAKDPPDTYAAEQTPLHTELLPVEVADLSAPSLSLNNATGYRPDLSALLSAPSPIEAFRPHPSGDTLPTFSSAEPLVLILHTHGTEAYSENTAGYAADASFRSLDREKNTVAVGKVMAEVLQSRGIPTVHCTVLHDEQSYSAAYDNAAASIRAYLEKYPSIRYILDIHRDSIVRADGTAIRPLTEIDGVPTAQVMLVVGTDEGGADHPHWQDNLNVAVKWQDALATYPGLMRPINLRKASFNGQYAPGAMIVEIGSCANTLEEAKNAARLAAEGLAELILGK